jgi:signal transduction histidine kinase
LTNLVSNALKYSPTGGEVTIAAEANDGAIHLQVSDQGLGLPPDALQRIFERFYRIEDERRQDIPGSGLGLYITKHLVELQGGRIWAESPGPGRGSTFHVLLPSVRVPEVVGV